MSIVKYISNTNKIQNAIERVPVRFYATSHKGDDYQFLQKSIIPTMHFQKSLPRLPIPLLKKTCERYLGAQRPLLIDEAYRHVESQTNSFCNGIGNTLDKQLRQFDKKNKHTSYISKMWFEMYLSDRSPLPINYNPVLVFHNDVKPEYNNQLVKAANILVSSLRFMRSLRADKLEPEVYHMNAAKSDTETFRKVTSFLPSAISWYGAYAFKTFPLDMSQYLGLFGSTRIPEMDMDRIVNNNSTKHILVQRNGYFYVFDVLDKDGYIIEPHQILSRLKYILEDTRPANEYPIGILTTQDRDMWASQRHHLSQIGNEKLMKLIDSALFNLVLDDETMADDKVKVIRNFLHGDGCNRWFDKSLSMIVTKDGVGGVNFEHSWGDGVAVLRYFQDIYKEMTTKPIVHPSTPTNEVDADKAVTKLDFHLDDKLKENIAMAKKTYSKWCSSLHIDYLIYDGLGKNSCKSSKVSPDSIMQLGFQAAYHLMTGKYVGTYESCSTAAFKHGRTETMRPCTMETKAFCDALHSSSEPSLSHMLEMIKKCSFKHGELTKEAAMGHGFDRHLFALKHMAQQNDTSLPGIYTDPEYSFLNKSIISTSTLQSPAVMAGGFGPVVTDGLGIGYSVMEKSLGCVVTSYPPHNSGKDFVEALKTSYEQIAKVLASQR